MMKIILPFNKNKLQNTKFELNQSDCDFLVLLFKEPTSILIYEESPIQEGKLLAIGKKLENEGKALMRLHVHHSCQNNVVEIRDDWANLPDKNKRCFVCKKPYGKNLKYDIELITKYAIRLI